MSSIPENANAECPGGPTAPNAGKAAACEGCPNASACASGTPAVDPGAAAVAARLARVRAVILVLSGKGGVGKSTFSAQLAFSLAARGRSVGLLDVDICGPSIPRMLGLAGARVHAAASGWSPVWLDDALGVMSVGFMLPGDDDAVIWRGPKKNGLIRQFLSDVEWGELDFLVIDTPPGTSDEHISLAQLLKGAPNLAGAVVVTTPQEVAMADVRKELSFCAKVGLRVLGVVENMSGFVCPCCATRSDIFATAGDGPAGMAARAGVPFLGALPIDPNLLAACEAGEAYVTKHAGSPGALALVAVVDKVEAAALAAVGGAAPAATPGAGDAADAAGA
jgi:Mrp family chromosome partitioning ATPase